MTKGKGGKQNQLATNPQPLVIDAAEKLDLLALLEAKLKAVAAVEVKLGHTVGAHHCSNLQETCENRVKDCCCCCCC